MERKTSTSKRESGFSKADGFLSWRAWAVENERYEISFDAFADTYQLDNLEGFKETLEQMFIEELDRARFRVISMRLECGEVTLEEIFHAYEHNPTRRLMRLFL